MKIRTTVAACLLSTFTAGVASAEEPGGASVVPGAASAATGSFGKAGHMVVGLERLFQFSMEKTKTETSITAPNGNKTTTSENESGTTFDFLGRSGTPHSIPHLSFSYFVVPNISVGLGLMYLSRSGDSERTTTAGSVSTTTKQEAPTTSFMVIAPRVGYAMGMGPRSSLWLRGGLTYWSSKTEDVNEQMGGAGATTTITTTEKTSGLALSLDPMLLLYPVEGVGFMIGPVVDFPLSGSGDRVTKTVNGSTSTETTLDITTLKYTQIGAAAGLAFFF